MKRLLISAFLLLSGITAAAAADLLTDGHDEAHAPYKQAFVGFGAGIDLGGQFTSIDIGGAFDGISADGLVVGAHAEYLFAHGSFRFGPYIEGGLSDVNTQIGGADVLTQDHYFGAGLKAGIVAYQTALISVHAGFERAKWSSDLFSGHATVDSWKLGGAVETMVAPNVSLGLNLDYLRPENVDVDGFDATSLLKDSEQGRALLRVTWRQ